MNHTEQLEELRQSAILAITLHINENGPIKLVDIDEEDWREDDETSDAFHELPTQMVLGKYYAIPYYIHYAYLEDGKLYFNALDMEEDNTYVFEADGLYSDTLCTIVDDYLN